MKSGRSTMTNANSNINSPSSPSGAKPMSGSSPVAPRFNESARVGLRKSVTRVCCKTLIQANYFFALLSKSAITMYYE